jgi:phage-related minor tail protein
LILGVAWLLIKGVTILVDVFRWFFGKGMERYQAFQEKWETGKNNLVAVWDGLIWAISTAWGGLVSWVQSIWNGLTGGLSNGMQFIQTAWAAMTAWLQLSWQEKLYSIAYFAGWVVGSIVRAVIDGFVWVGETLVGFYNQTTALFNALWIALQAGFWWTVEFVISLWNAFLIFMSELPNRVYEFMERAKAVITLAIQLAIAYGILKFSEFVTFLSEIPAKANDIFEQFKTFVSQKFQEVYEKGKTTWEGIVLALKTIDLVQVGKDMIQGLINGVTSMANTLKQTASNMARQFVQGFKDAMQIASPSKLMEEMGEFVGEGLVVGIDSSQVDVARASANMASAVATPVGNSFNNVVIVFVIKCICFC